MAKPSLAIAFEYRPSPLEAHGWSIESDARHVPAATVTDGVAPTVGKFVRMDLKAGTHYNYILPTEVQRISRVRFVLADTFSFLVYIKLSVLSPGGHPATSWYALRHASGSLRVPENLSPSEWVVPARRSMVEQGWIALDVDVVRTFQRTFALGGYRLRRVDGIRVRELTTLAGVDLFEDPLGVDSTWSSG